MTALSLFQTIGGLLLLFLGGELLLRGAVSLARLLGLSPLFIGLTVVAFATSMPELVVSLTASFGGVPDVAVGNIVGSNIANILLILGTAAAISPIVTRRVVVVRDLGAVLVATAVFAGFALLGPLGQLQGAVMLTLLGLQIWLSYLHERRPRGRSGRSPEAEALEDLAPRPRGLRLALGFVVTGAGTLVLGSDLLVTGAVEIARAAGISESVIGLTLIAIGTSLPELAAAIVSALRRHADVALGNALGSNIFNLLLVLGSLVLVSPLRPAAEILRFDLWIMVGVTLLTIPIMLSGWRISRREGAFFLLAYAGYVWVQFAP